MTTDYLIIGQGIAGTLLSYHLLQAGRQVVVIDNDTAHKASLVAGAVINPLSGKKWTESPDAGLFVPDALACYRELETLLGKPLLQQVPMYIFAGEAAAQPDLPLCKEQEHTALDNLFRYPGQLFRNDRAWLVDAATLLKEWSAYLQDRGMLCREVYRHEACVIGAEGVQYRDITAKKIIYCEGAAGAANPLWAPLPFTRNRGEALLLHIPQLPAPAIYHYKRRLIPRGEGLFWYGSNYQWDFTGLEPDAGWKAEAIRELEQWLKVPFTVTDHKVAERPTTAGQIPLVGVHPQIPAVAIFNGLGTRGFSAGPFWAAELAKQLTDPSYKIRHYQEDWLNKKLG